MKRNQLYSVVMGAYVTEYWQVQFSLEFRNTCGELSYLKLTYFTKNNFTHTHIHVYTVKIHYVQSQERINLSKVQKNKQ